MNSMPFAAAGTGARAVPHGLDVQPPPAATAAFRLRALPGRRHERHNEHPILPIALGR